MYYTSKTNPKTPTSSSMRTKTTTTTTAIGKMAAAKMLACGFDLLFQFNLCCERNFWPMLYANMRAYTIVIPRRANDTCSRVEVETKKNCGYEITLIYDFDYTAAKNCLFVPLFFLFCSDVIRFGRDSNRNLCQVRILCDIGAY